MSLIESTKLISMSDSPLLFHSQCSIIFECGASHSFHFLYYSLIISSN
uniref:Uncharacterized protein n=1 Tax=Manihot esculenta TaxID=3983 RepID=A0A2C9VB16_MANES